jgi:ABC-type uncharacterized transport system permease subunit
MLQPPALILALVLASLYAVLFHLWRGRGWRDLLFLWLAALIGFASGHLVGQLWGFVPWTIGQLHVIEGTVVALVLMGLARWLAQEREVA